MILSSMMEGGRSGWTVFSAGLLHKPFFHLLLISLTCLAVYSNTFNSPFQWDEEVFLENNPAIRDMHYFFHPAKEEAPDFHAALRNRFIGYFTFALNYRIHGFDITGYHIFNILVHMLNSILVYFFATLTFRTQFLANSKLRKDTDKIALFAALLFVSHPIQIEAVTYIFQRFASLVTLFYLLSLVMYISFRLRMEASINGWSRPAVVCYLLSVLSAVFAMKTKENAFTLPIVIALYELLFFWGAWKKRLLYLAPLLLTLLIIPMTLIGTDRPAGEIISQVKDPASLGYQGISGEHYLFTQFRVVLTYLRLLLLPVNQNIEYDYPVYHSFFEPGAVISVLVLLSIFCSGIYLFYRSRSNPALRIISFGIFWFFMTLSVESSIIPIPMIICEYRLYLASAGVFIALISGLFLLAEKSGNKKIKSYLMISLVLLLVLFSAATYVRNSLWGSTTSLWEDVVRKSPSGTRGHNNLGKSYLKQNRISEAVDELSASIKLGPGNAEAHNNIGLAHEKQGHSGEAVISFNRALHLKPDFAEAHLNLGVSYVSQGRLEEAISEFSNAIKLRPGFAKAHFNIAIAYDKQNRIDDAVSEYKAALKLDSAYADALNNLAVDYEKKGLIDEATDAYKTVLKLRPDFVSAHNNLGTIYADKGHMDEAISEYKTALRFDPDNFEAHNNLGISYAKQGRLDEAVIEYKTALKLKPDNFVAHSNLGEAYADQNRFDEAIVEFKNALRLKPDFAEARKNLEVCYEKMKKMKR